MRDTAVDISPVRTVLAQRECLPPNGFSANISAYKLHALNYSPDEFVISGTEVYLHCPSAYRETMLSNKFFVSTLNVSATTRNCNTNTKLFELATTL